MKKNRRGKFVITIKTLVPSFGAPIYTRSHILLFVRDLNGGLSSGITSSHSLLLKTSIFCYLLFPHQRLYFSPFSFGIYVNFCGVVVGSSVICRGFRFSPAILCFFSS